MSRLGKTFASRHGNVTALADITSPPSGPAAGPAHALEAEAVRIRRTVLIRSITERSFDLDA